MRNSPLRHPLAVLRTTIGLTQKELGALVNRAARTIQSIELGQLPLSEYLAMKIADATGVAVGWLLEGDPAVPPPKGLTAQSMGTGTGVYSRSHFEFHRAFLESPAASRQEIETALKKAGVEEGKTHGNIAVSMPYFKGALLLHKKRLLQPLDQKLVEALKHLLEQTTVAAGGDLVRWKIRRTLLSLAEENAIKLDLPPTAPEAVGHIHLAGEDDHKPRRRNRKQ